VLKTSLLFAALMLAGLTAGPAQVLEIDSLSPYGSLPGTIEGRVTGVNPQEYKIAPLIFLPDMGYFSKPYCTATTTALASDGSFSVLLTTGGVDELATRITLLLVPAGATVPCCTGTSGIPAGLEALAVTRIDIRRPNPAQRVIEFAGGDWLAKASDALVGPGPNRFSGSPDNVWVDRQGRLHLRITSRGGQWYCAEAVSRRVTGYGVYQFTLDTPPGLDPSVVFGAFTFAEAERDNREIDALEIGKFGGTGSTNAQYVVQPWDQPGHLTRLTLEDSAPTTHVMRWEPGRVVFQSFLGEEAAESRKISEWVFTGQAPAAAGVETNFRFNLWLYNQPPANGREVEVVVRDFRHQPLPEAGGGPAPAAVVDAASFLPKGAPGGLISIFGEALAEQKVVAERTPLPFELGGVSVLVNGLPAPLLYASPTQINAQAPYLAPPGPAVVTVRTGGLPGAAPFWLNAAAPAVFINPPNFCLAQNPNLALNSAAAPAAPDSVVVAYLTGLGAVSPAVATGAAAPDSPLSRPVLPVWAKLSGLDAAVEFLGLAPRLVGVGQLNIRIPRMLEPGVHPLTVGVGDAESSPCLLGVGTEPLVVGPPVIRSVAPQTGRAGDVVVISGAGFQPWATVTFGSTPAARTTYGDAQTLRATLPPGSGTSSVTVTNPDGRQATLANAFTYLSTPSVSRVSPASGPEAGGTLVTITGNDFRAGAMVYFGPNLAPSVQFLDARTLRATTPAGSGAVTVRVINPDSQSAELAGAFTYLKAPSVFSVSPDSGPATGGTVVTITGANFAPGASVRFGSAAATGVVFVSSTTLRATSPAGEGVVSVTVTNPDLQAASLAGAFTYTAVAGPSPAITAQIQGCTVSGTVSGVAPPSAFRVLVWAYTNQYYIQPCDTERTQAIRSDSKWGPVDSHNGQIWVQLVRAGYTPPASAGALPAKDGVNVLATSGPVGTLTGCDVARCPAQ